MTGIACRLFLLVAVLFFFPAKATAHSIHPLGITDLDWKRPGIARVATSLMDFQSGGLVLSWVGRGEIVEIEGRACLRGGYFLFDVDDDYAFDTDETIVVTLDMPDDGGALVSYDHAVESPSVTPVAATKAGASIKLERARFANRLYAGADFAVAAPGALYPYDANKPQQVTICDLQLSREGKKPSHAVSHSDSEGTLVLSISDVNGKTAARVGVYDKSGRMPIPSEDAIEIRRFNETVRQMPIVKTREFWPAPGGYAFYAGGDYRAALPAGDYSVVVMKGPENQVFRKDFSIIKGRETKIEATLEPWKNPADEHWYSGDVHVHVARERDDNASILSAMSAENLNVTNLLQMANVVRSHFPQYAFGKDGLYRQGGNALVSGQEAPRSGHRGHTIGLNADHYVEPDAFFLYHQIAQSVRDGGGLYGYAHLLGDAFHARRGLAIDAPLGLVDFVEILQFGVVDTQTYYDLLNLGFRIAPAAGSDYPYIDMPGAGRSYVRIDGDFTSDEWFEGLKAGRTYVSNAPLLSLAAGEAGMGDTVRLNAGDMLEINAAASVNPDFDQLDRLELVRRGEVVKTATTPDADGVLRLHTSLQFDEGGWIAVRTYGKGMAVAHSAPIYIEAGGSPDTFDRTQVDALTRAFISEIDTMLNTEPLAREDLEHWETGDALLAQWRVQRDELKVQAKKARARLRQIRKQALED